MSWNKPEVYINRNLDTDRFGNNLDKLLFADRGIDYTSNVSIDGRNVDIPFLVLDLTKQNEGYIVYSTPNDYPVVPGEGENIRYSPKTKKMEGNRIVDLAVKSYALDKAIGVFKKYASSGFIQSLKNMELIKIIAPLIDQYLSEDSYLIVRGTTIDNPLYGGTRIPTPKPDEVESGYYSSNKNWLDLDFVFITNSDLSEDVMNIFYSQPLIDIFEIASYINPDRNKRMLKLFARDINGKLKKLYERRINNELQDRINTKRKLHKLKKDELSGYRIDVFVNHPKSLSKKYDEWFKIPVDDPKIGIPHPNIPYIMRSWPPIRQSETCKFFKKNKYPLKYCNISLTS